MPSGTGRLHSMRSSFCWKRCQWCLVVQKICRVWLLVAYAVPATKLPEWQNFLKSCGNQKIEEKKKYQLTSVSLLTVYLHFIWNIVFCVCVFETIILKWWCHCSQILTLEDCPLFTFDALVHGFYRNTNTPCLVQSQFAWDKFQSDAMRQTKRRVISRQTHHCSNSSIKAVENTRN